MKVEVKLLEEEVTVDRKLTGNSVVVVRGDNMECLEEINKLKTEVSELRKSQKSIKISNQEGRSLPSIECPVCLEPVRPPMRLMQCGKGHILCQDCYRKSREEARRKEEGERDMARCPQCNGEITGRPAVLERVLGLLDEV